MDSGVVNGKYELKPIIFNRISSFVYAYTHVDMFMVHTTFVVI